MSTAAGRQFAGDLLIPNGTYNGKDACLDLLGDGLQNPARFEFSTGYAKGEIIGVPIQAAGGIIPEVIEGHKWYVAARDFTSPSAGNMTIEQAFEAMIASHALTPADDDIQKHLDPGSPLPFVYGMPFKIAGFNFKLKNTEEGLAFYESISGMDYVNPEVFLPMLDSVLERETANIGEVLMTDVKLIQQYLITKLRTAERIIDYRNIADIYEHLFLIDPIRDWYTQGDFDVDAQLMTTYGLTAEELYSFKHYFTSEGIVVVNYHGDEYTVMLNEVLNNKVDTIEINDTYPFTNKQFIEAFQTAVLNATDIQSIEESSLSDKIKHNQTWKQIIISKAWYDYGDVDGYPRTYEDLLMRNNNSLYSFLMDLKKDKNSEDSVTLLRAIIKALESYTNTSLAGLEFKALGVDNYFYILKEVISYFKSYMVEFTRDEFVYIFDGIFDNGGHPNMLKLIDEFVQGTVNAIPHDSMTLYDVSCADVTYGLNDDNVGFIRDEAIFRIKATFETLVNSGYELWYDDGKRITRNIPTIPNDTEIIANVIPDDNDPAAYKIIINVDNTSLPPSNYYGNTR
jgi:hypothetical protein